MNELVLLNLNNSYSLVKKLVYHRFNRGGFSGAAVAVKQNVVGNLTPCKGGCVLNELLLLFTENRIIEFVSDNRSEDRGYLICGHCGIAAYMVLTAMYILNKKNYTVSQFLIG